MVELEVKLRMMVTCIYMRSAGGSELMNPPIRTGRLGFCYRFVCLLFGWLVGALSVSELRQLMISLHVRISTRELKKVFYIRTHLSRASAKSRSIFF